MRLLRGSVAFLSLFLLVSGCVRPENPRLESLPSDMPEPRLQIPNIQVGPRSDATPEAQDEPPLLLPALTIPKDVFYAVNQTPGMPCAHFAA